MYTAAMQHSQHRVQHNVAPLQLRLLAFRILGPFSSSLNVSVRDGDFAASMMKPLRALGHVLLPSLLLLLLLQQLDRWSRTVCMLMLNVCFVLWRFQCATLCM
jgi:hypothetical protein